MNDIADKKERLNKLFILDKSEGLAIKIGELFNDLFEDLKISGNRARFPSIALTAVSITLAGLALDFRKNEVPCNINSILRDITKYTKEVYKGFCEQQGIK